MFDEEGEGRAGEVGEAFYFRMDEGREGDAIDLRGGVYDSYFHYCV